MVIIDDNEKDFNANLLASACKVIFPYLKDCIIIDNGVKISFQYNANHTKVRTRLSKLPVSVFHTTANLQDEDITNISYLIKKYDFLNVTEEEQQPAPSSVKKSTKRKQTTSHPSAPVPKKKAITVQQSLTQRRKQVFNNQASESEEDSLVVDDE